MTIQNELQAMSFRGVSFFWTSITTSGGRKIVSHEYPLKNTRFVEDLGLLDLSFAIEATVSSNNYRQNIETLKNALSKEGSATLVVSSQGSYECQVISWSLAENIGSLGNARFTINFEKTEKNIFPIETSLNTSAITNQSQGLFAKIKDNIADKYKTVANKFKAFNTIKDKMTDYGNKIRSVANKFRQVQGNINEFSNSINNFIEDINSLIIAPAQLAASINNLTEQLQVLFEKPSDVFSFFEGMFDFGDDDIIFSELNSERILINENNNILNSNLQASALVGAYQSVVNLDFLTTEEIENIKERLEIQYTKLDENENLDYEIKELLQNLRNEIYRYLEQQKKVALNVKTIRVYNEPITVLSYRFYGDLENTQNLIDLNNIDNYSFINDEFNILAN